MPHWSNVKAIVFDFDGVFTDNKVYLDEHGKESVRCDRSDGLAFDILRRFISLNNWSTEYLILSKETNPVVLERAKKIKVPCMHNVSKKDLFLTDFLSSKSINQPLWFMQVMI